MLIGIIGWAALGVAIGFVLSKSVNLHGDDPRLGVVLGAVGAVIGGWLFSLISGSPVVAFNLWSLIVAAIVAGVAVAAWHVARSRGTHARPSIRRSY